MERPKIYLKFSGAPALEIDLGKSLAMSKEEIIKFIGFYMEPENEEKEDEKMDK